MEDPGAAWTEAARAGDHFAAWAISDRVLALRDPATRDDLSLPYHQRWVWDGRNLDGCHVLVRCYHGLGDTLQFARFLPALSMRAASVTVEAQPGLLPLLARVPGPDRLIPFVPHAPAPPAERDVEIMELSHALRLAPEACPAPYLRAAPDAPERAIGLCWRAGGWDPGRSVPPEQLAAIARRRCVSLQPGPAALSVLNPEGCPASIERTASLISGLDLVVTVDTMVAHLAGALGRPTWLLLKHEADWRWMAGRDDSPWYPSLRLSRQTAHGDWTGAVARVADDLRARN